MRVRAAPFTLVAMVTLASLAACSRVADDDPAAISADDERQLNDAAAMLDANSVEAHTPNSTESSAHD